MDLGGYNMNYKNKIEKQLEKEYIISEIKTQGEKIYKEKTLHISEGSKNVKLIT